MKASNETANSGTSGDQCIAFFDQEIAHRMDVLDSDCKSKYHSLIGFIVTILHSSFCAEKELCQIVPLFTRRLQTDD